MRIEDLDRLEELQKILFPVRYQRSFYEKLLKEGYYSVLAVTPNDELAGVATARVRVIEDGSWWNLFAGEVKEGYIMTLGVSPAYRRKGLGSVLLRKICRVLEEEAEVDVSSLHVQEINRAAVEFYRKNGFKVAAELPDHYLIEGVSYSALRMVQTVSYPRTQRCNLWATISSCGL